MWQQSRFRGAATSLKEPRIAELIIERLAKPVASMQTAFWFLVFGFLCSHTASTPITAGTFTSGAQ